MNLHDTAYIIGFALAAGIVIGMILDLIAWVT